MPVQEPGHNSHDFAEQDASKDNSLFTAQWDSCVPLGHSHECEALKTRNEMFSVDGCHLMEKAHHKK